MPYITVIDPETGEKKIEWREQPSSSLPEEKQESTEENRGIGETITAVANKFYKHQPAHRMAINAGIGAVQEASDTIRDIGGAFGIGEGTTREEPDKPIIGLGGWKPERLESTGVVEDIGTGILQFGLEWVLLAKALKGVNWALKGSKTIANIGTKARNLKAGAITLASKSPIAPKTAQTVTKYGTKILTETSPRAAVIDFVGFDQYEGRLYDLVAEADKWDVIEKIPLLNILETNPEDEGLTGRAKNALEGFFIDIGIGSVLSARSLLKIRKAKNLAKRLAETPKGSAEYKELLPKVIQQEEILENIPEIKKRLSEQEIQARIDRRTFDKARADLSPAERDRVWKQIQETNKNLIVDKQGVKTISGDLESVRQQIQELGPEPTKPKSFYQMVDGKKKMTTEGKAWTKWNKTNKPLQERLKELAKSQSEIDNVQITNRERSIAEGIKRGDIPFDDEVRQLIQDGDSYDQIIEKVTSRKPKPFTAIDEDPRGLSKTRGPEKIKERIMKKFPSDGIDIEEAEGIEEFINIIGERMFDDVGISIKGALDPRKDGEFNFLTNLVSIRKKIIEEGKLERTVVHELWHSLSRYLPKADLARYKKEFLREQKKYLERWEKAKKAWIEKTTPEDLQMRLQFDSLGSPFKGVKKITEKNFASEAAKYFDKNKFKGESDYRYTNIDEYFAENMTDAFFSKLDEGLNLDYKGITKGNQFIQTDSFKSLIYKIGIYFRDLIANIHARLGGPQTKKIFNDFLQQRNTVLERDHPLGWSDDAISSFEMTKEGVEREMAVKTRTGEIIRDSQLKPEDFVVEKKGDVDDPRGFYDEEVEGLSQDVLRNVKDVVEGKKPLLESAGLWDIEQDVTRLRSPKKGTPYYSAASEEGSDFEIILNAISKRWDRIELTGMESLSGRKIAQELESVFRKDGLNLQEILQDESLIGATELFQRNRENVTNLIKLKFALNFSAEQASKWATQSINAVNNPRINQTEALIKMHRYLNSALQFANVYEVWTRSAGQLLQTAQTQINAQGLTETLKRQSLSFDKASAIAEASKVPADVFYTNLPPDYIRALDTGEWTPRAESFRHQIETLVLDTDTEHGLKTIQDFLGKPDSKEGIKKSKNIDGYEKKTKALAVYYVNNLLSAAKTWAVQTSGLARTIAEPAFMAVTNGNHRIATMQYEYMVRTFYGSLKLGQKAWLTGQSLYDPKIRTGALAADIAGQADMNSTYARNRAYQLQDPHPSYDLNKTPFVNELKNNPAHHTANILWKLGTWNIRGQLAMDTFTKSLAGNSLAYVVGLEEGLTQGAAKGLKGKDLKTFAEQWADAKVEFYTFDAVINGETIANAIMKDESAIQIGRILTFTDEVRAKMPHRTKRYGMELAKQRGLTDPGEIEQFATAYRNGDLEGAQKLWNRFMRSADGIVQQADNLQRLPGVGEITPTLTSTWSQIPQAWGGLQSKRHGFIASFIQPFNRSPGDITKQWIRMIPGLNMTVDTFYRDLFNENAYLRNRWKAEVAIGTTTGGLFAATVLNNDEFPIEFTGYGPNNPQMRKEWTDAERPALSWRTRGRDKDGNPVYGRWHSYRGFEPAATFIAGLADYKMLYADMSEEDRLNLVNGFSVSIAAQVMLGRFNSTYYKGIVEFLDAVADVMPITNGGFMKRELEASERNKLSRYMQRLLTNFIPESGRMREVSRAMDRYKRTVDSSVKPIQSFNEADEGLVKMRDARGVVIYLKKEDAEFQDGNQFMTWIANYWRQQIDEVKNTIPGFSEELPERINWVTGLPIRNAGFLGSDQLPYDDAPWLSRLTGAYFGTLAGTPSEFGIGAKGHVFDPRTPKQKKAGTITKNYMAALVNDEMIKISRAGGTFPPPRPTDFGKGIRLSAPAFRKYKEYIYTVEIGGKTLLESIYTRMTTPGYKRLKYIIHPLDSQDGREGFQKADYIEEIINDFKKKAKEYFRNDFNNEYRMEVILEERRIKAGEELQERERRGGKLDPIYEEGGNIDLNAKQFADKLNQ